MCDDEDYQKHFDYIHFNPVKHKLVKKVSEWKWSSFHRYFEKGYYPVGWGERDEMDWDEGRLGE